VFPNLRAGAALTVLVAANNTSAPLAAVKEIDVFTSDLKTPLL
jgi:hypothetical protein